jgi:hypothetical protein
VYWLLLSSSHIGYFAYHLPSRLHTDFLLLRASALISSFLRRLTIFVSPQDKVEECTLNFVEGRCVAINGVFKDSYAIMAEANGAPF